MLISFPCAKCATVLEVEGAAVGAEVECPQCGTSQTIPRIEIGPGVTLGGFRIEKLLASGGMGKVFLARQLSMDREVALKILPPQFALDPEDIERFLNEVRVLARLEHPNIVPAYEAGEDGGVNFLAMAYVRGESLDRLIKREGPMQEQAALTLAGKVAAALAYAWNRHHVVHRDVKPENILLDENGEPRLTDLGLSKRIDKSSAAITLVGSVIGTPNYMSPEQMEDLGTADARSDIYSLGVTLHHMLTGQVPFEGGTVVKTFQQVAAQSLPDPRQAAPQVSARCVTLLEGMLAKDPRHRYATWEDVIEDMTRVQAGQPLRHALASPAQSVLRRMELHPPGSGAPRNRPPTARLHVPAQPAPAPHAHQRPHVLHVPHVPHAQPAQHAPAAAPAPRKSRALPLAIGAAAVALAVVGVGLSLLARERSRERIRQEHARSLAAAEQGRLDALQQKVRAAAAFAASRPDAYATALQGLEQARDAAAGTDAEGEANGAIARLKAEHTRVVARQVAELKRKVAELTAADRLDEALAMTRDDSAPLAAETAEERRKLAAPLEDRLKTRHSAAQLAAAGARAAALAQVARLTDALADDLLKGDGAGAQARLEAAAQDASLGAATQEWTTVRDRCQAVLGVPAVLLASFLPEVGRTVTVGLKSGPESLLIDSVAEGCVIVQRRVTAGAAVQRRFGLADLSVAERLRRLGTGTAGETEIARGLLALDSRSYDAARASFARAACPLALAMARGVDGLASGDAIARNGQRQAEADAAAAKDYRLILQSLGMDMGEDDIRQTSEELSEKNVGELTLRRTKEQVRAFRLRHGASNFALAHEPVLALIDQAKTGAERLGPNAAQAALARLKAANPGMLINPRAQFTGKEITLDLSNEPVLQDISALAGLPIRALKLDKTKVENLDPLRGMPLKELSLAGCGFVKDLSPLQGAPLASLNLNGCATVLDFTALQGMPLETLHLQGTRFADIALLKDARLMWLSVRTCKNVNDLSPLKGQPLTYLDAGFTSVTDLTPLAGMPLTVVNVDGCAALSDLTPLRNAPLTALRISRTAVKDISPVRGIRTLTDIVQ